MGKSESRFYRKHEAPDMDDNQSGLAGVVGFALMTLACCCLYAWIMIVELPAAIDREFPESSATVVSTTYVTEGGMAGRP